MTSLNALLGLAESMETSAGDIMGIPGDLTTIIDPALLQALGELGLSEDLGTLDAVEQATRLDLNAQEQRRRLGQDFEREQELTGANLSERGIFIDADDNQGLVTEVGTALGERQGRRLADFEAGTGEQFRSIASQLGMLGLTNAADIGRVLSGAIGRNAQEAVDMIPDIGL